MTVRGGFFAALIASLVASVGFAIPAVAEDDDPLVAEVDGHEIYLSDVESARSLLPPRLQSQSLETIYPILVNSYLAAEEARDMDLHKKPEYEKRMERIGDQLLERMLLSQVIEAQITDEQVQKRYDELRVQAENSFELHARHILLGTDDAARMVLEKLQAGEDFAVLAKAHSIDSSASSGGDLGWFGPGDMVIAFEDAAMALSPGETTQAPVQTKYGWHIIKVEERRALVIPSFEEARPAIANELAATAGKTLMEKLRGDVDITQVDWAELKKELPPELPPEPQPEPQQEPQQEAK